MEGFKTLTTGLALFKLELILLRMMSGLQCMIVKSLNYVRDGSPIRYSSQIFPISLCH